MFILISLQTCNQQFLGAGYAISKQTLCSLL